MLPEAAENARRAAESAPGDARLQGNLALLERALEEANR